MDVTARLLYLKKTNLVFKIPYNLTPDYLNVFKYMYIKSAQDQRDLVRVIPYTYQGHGRNILRGLLTCLLLFYGMNYQSPLETVQR